MNDMESAVDRLLKSAKLRDDNGMDDANMGDALTTKDYTLEEVKARRAELRRARDLLSRAQVKAQRIAKIKSKTYRKIRRKGKDKDALQEAELADLDPEFAAMERLRQEAERAKERATLRHKSGSKWMRASKNGFNDSTDKKKSIEVALRRSEDLRRKIAGQPESDAEGDDSDEDLDHIKSMAMQELAELSRNDDTAAPASGVFAMKFMQEAAARQAQRVDEEINDFRKELGADVNAGSDDQLPPGDTMTSLLVGGNRGRLVYQPGKPHVSLPSCFILLP